MVGGEEGVMYQTLAGQSVDFILVIKDEKAAKKVLVHALVSHEGEASTQEELPVQDNGDRSYVFSYCPETDGPCTLSVMVEGENVPGSPFTWKVKPKVHYSELLSVPASGQEQHVVETEKHCWKIKMHLDCNSRRNFEIGIRCLEQADGKFSYFDVEVKRSSWCYFCKRRGRLQFSRSDNPRAATINSLRHGDVFSVYLNFDTKKLVIYNARSKQTEVFTDALEGDKVVPIISPYVQSMQNPESGLSLDIK